MHNKKFFVSGGFIGNPGDFVVDDAEDPQLIFGFISEDGRFKRDLRIFDMNRQDIKGKILSVIPAISGNQGIKKNIINQYDYS